MKETRTAVEEPPHYEKRGGIGQRGSALAAELMNFLLGTASLDLMTRPCRLHALGQSISLGGCIDNQYFNRAPQDVVLSPN